MKFYNLLRSVSNYIENPELFRLRSKGVSAAQYTRYGSTWIRRLNPLTIFDIGANAGESAIALHGLYPQARIYSFEPIPSCFQSLVEKTKNIPNIQAFNLGLGDINGELEFELNNFSAASSFLSLSDSHKKLYDYATKTQIIKVNVDKLDNFIDQIEIKPPILIKIDVQGFEDKVIRGGEQVFKQTDVIIVETSFQSLYVGQPLFEDIYAMLYDWGFRYRGSVENMYDPANGRIVQADTVFVRM
jgi:FkbM family methyltransferase